MSEARSVALVSLGCPKNLVDSENLVAALVAGGFRVLREPEEADLVLVNTCGFLEAAREESVEAIRGAAALKRKGVKGVLVAGCMVPRHRAEIARAVPGVDAFVDFADYPRIDELVDRVLPRDGPPTFMEARRHMDAALTPAHYAYLKISEGCNHTCSFCIIPDIRGRMRSRPVDDLVRRAEALAARGVKELVLIAQDSTAYGADLYGGVRLTRLLERLDGVEGLEWIRLMYAYPTEVRDELAGVLAAGRRVLPYLDMPIQHASDRILRRMRRGYTRRDVERAVERLRAAHPGMALRTTVIVGFPGETEEDFEELLELVRRVHFDRLGAFCYSREPGSRADGLEGHLPEEVKQERYHRLMSLQQELAFQANRHLPGASESVLLDWADPTGRHARGRTRRDAPEVDAAVRVRGDRLRAGDLVPVQITGTEGYDLTAAARSTGMAV